MYFLLPLLPPLCLTNLLLVCRPFFLLLYFVLRTFAHVCVGKLLCSLSGSGRADQASWEPPVGLGDSREKTVEFWQANSNLTFLLSSIASVYTFCYIRFFLLFIILSTFKAVRTVKTMRYF